MGKWTAFSRENWVYGTWGGVGNMGEWQVVTKTSRIRARKPHYGVLPHYYPTEFSDFPARLEHAKSVFT